LAAEFFPLSAYAQTLSKATMEQQKHPQQKHPQQKQRYFVAHIRPTACMNVPRAADTNCWFEKALPSA